MIEEFLEVIKSSIAQLWLKVFKISINIVTSLNKDSWQNHVDWMRSLPPSELKLLQSADLGNSEVPVNSDTNLDTTASAAPPEQLLYENLKQKSHFASLCDQLVLMMKPSLRQEFASYISQQSAIAGYKTLVPANLQKASDLAVANLYWYFKVRDESEAEAVTA
jgi:hypothetical protein